MQQLTFTEENYLKNIYSLQHKNESGEVSVNEISERMKTKPATVTDMLRKLSEKNLIHYERYKKVRLTDKGVTKALQIIRKHRLWETFLHDKLHFSWDEVHEVAEQLEHIHSQKLIDRLDGYLDYPQFDPHGDPIPDSDGKLPSSSNLLLSEAEMNNTYIITAVKDTTSPFLQQLERFGLQIGKFVTTIEVMGYDKSILIELEKSPSILLSEKIARNLIVSEVER
ncbi:MAG TPA: metal-dependent transcriptional regulator [Flavipsychrobacter sp.]|jgi:DtxR family Mn-dependent transcriptional regulator|nr:metal-dependent transcriptional regulator [Flavipsychrobacter sp.]